jgi:chemotaxis protein MotB
MAREAPPAQLRAEPVSTSVLHHARHAARVAALGPVRLGWHTDDVPTDAKGPFPSNWELSLARSMAVVRSRQDAGVDPTVLSAAGYGPYQPIAPNDSPENRSLNRRIEIVLAPGVATGGR